MDNPGTNPGTVPSQQDQEEAVASAMRDAETPPAEAAQSISDGADPVVPGTHRRKRSPRWGDVLGALQSLAITVVIAVFVITFVVQAFQIPSGSMEDTLLVGDYLLVDKIHFGYAGIWGEVLPYTKIKRGDIVVFHYPVRPEQDFVKRVIGLPGDRIRITERQVSINGQRLREPYVVYRASGHNSYRDDFPRLDLLSANTEASWWLQMRSLVHNDELAVPAGRYFVLGDNRDQSLDSRYWGFVPQENIIGRPLLIYWSIRHPERLGRVADSQGGKLLSFPYAVTHWLHDTRWNRTFRLIR